MKPTLSKNSWVLVCIVALAWSFSYWSEKKEPATCSIWGQTSLVQNEVVYKAIPQNYHLIHLQIGGSKYYRENIPAWVKVEVEVDEDGNYKSHELMGASHEYLEYRLEKYISDMRFLPAYNKSGPTSSSLILQFVY
ncbi:MAG: hypothetical protein MRZ79_20450 [Bacteroidia bacterium]|nr:hypothetical protein [Bacteroidia bacterium]